MPWRTDELRRGATCAAVSLGFAAGAEHVEAGGSPPTFATLLLALTVLTPVMAATLARPRTATTVAGVLGATQLAAHVVFGMAGGHTHALGGPGGTPAQLAAAGLTASMVLWHLAATLGVAVVLGLGDRLLAALAELLAPYAALLPRVGPARRPLSSPVEHDVSALRTVVLTGGLGRRGPPAFVLR
jgi:hypothetical protein